MMLVLEAEKKIKNPNATPDEVRKAGETLGLPQKDIEILWAEAVLRQDR